LIYLFINLLIGVCVLLLV